MKMENFEAKVDNASEEELQSLKTWLFQENIRLAAAFKELEAQQDKMQQEKEQFQQEVRLISQRVSSARKRLKEDEQFFQKKMEILQGGFRQLEEDRKHLERERSRQRELPLTDDDVSMLFCGVQSRLALKKRYKDLIKIFHPDNVAGDKEVLQQINREYELLKQKYEE